MSGGAGFCPVTWKVSVKHLEAVLEAMPLAARIPSSPLSVNNSATICIDGPVITNVWKSSLNCVEKLNVNKNFIQIDFNL